MDIALLRKYTELRSTEQNTSKKTTKVKRSWLQVAFLAFVFDFSFMNSIEFDYILKMLNNLI